ncbi:uncharacterized protein Dwil_GK10333 [Drosophila willistoni]|uniref:Uncharacterized protein n=1 Tax=Drosophila willistoni TaxID=7260 RepID=B4MJ61_DROWI|nr:uncharacterized protein LOC6638057 [Drosophila willistoni]EDW72150.2 uncharacterized protein Dwil_GK10333 [Drosophila willistoni]
MPVSKMTDKKVKIGQLKSLTSEEARRERAERRLSYGNKLSTMNLNRMRNRQCAAAMINPIANAAKLVSSMGKMVFVDPKPKPKAKASPESEPPHQMEVLKPSAKEEDLKSLSEQANPESSQEAAVLMPSASVTMSLRRIASSYAHVCEAEMGCAEALPNEDNEEDAREERAEVLIKSQTMPPPSSTPSLPVTLPIPGSSAANPYKFSAFTTASSSLSSPSFSLVHSGKEDDDPIDLLDPIVETRATERWQQLGNTVSALFRTRRCHDSQESPMTRLRRVREQRELLEAFTRPFLYESMKRD